MSKIVKRISIGLGLLAGLFLLAAGYVYLSSTIRLNRKHAIPALPALRLSTDSTLLARGKHLATSFGNCTECHGTDLGGKIYSDVYPLVRVVGPNLTRGKGGVGGQLSEEDWIRAIRHGVHKDGTSLVVMPSEVYVHMSKSDLSALISYLKQLPPVNRQLPTTKFYYMGRALLALGKLNILVAEKTEQFALPDSAQPRVDITYGRYLADMSGCRGCHGLNLSGGRVTGPPGTPLTTNLTPVGLGTWQESDLKRVLREGKRPDGTRISDFMPWKSIGRMTDDEIHALWLFLKSVPPRETGNR